MVDLPVGVPVPRAGVVRWRAKLAAWLLPGGLTRSQAWLMIAVMIVVLARYFYRSEGPPSNILFSVAVTIGIAALIAALSRRVTFSVFLTAAAVANIVLISGVKREKMAQVAHAYDLIFYLSSWSTITYLWSDYRAYVLGFAGGLALMGLSGIIVYRIDPLRISRRPALAMLAMAGMLTWTGAELKGERRHMQFYFENLLVSSFYASWAETIETLWRGQLVEASPRTNGAPFDVPKECRVHEKPPHIILIHQESVAPPGLFKGLSYDRKLDDFFVSGDGRFHKMRVETYGGASWLTEFSILAGISTHSFGGMRQFVQTLMEGKIRDTLPHALARCGYRNVVFYPMLKNFVSNDRFYKSIGLKEIYDMKDQGATKVNERDRFYYANALAEMERHMKPGADARGETASQPLFTFIQTMATHWPYDVTYEPDARVAGGGPGTHPEINEYLRRLALAKMDYEHFRAELVRRFPDERFLILHYGDHQPTPTRTLLGFKDEADAEDVVIDHDSLGMITYYAAEGLNYRMPALPALEVVDVPYLGMILLEAAGLPLSPAQVERKRLLGVCGGRYYTCPHRDQILGFHRRLITSGIMEAR